LKQKIESGGWASVMFLNFVGFSWDIVSIASGLTKIRYKDFLLAISITSIVQGLITVYFGIVIFSIRSLNDILQPKVLIALAITLLGITLPLIIRKRLNRNATSRN